MKNIISIIILVIALPSLADTILVIADKSENLDYVKDKQLYKFSDDIKGMKAQFEKGDKTQLVYVEINKVKENRYSGKLSVLGNGSKLNKKFKKVERLNEVYSEYIEGSRTNLILLGHTYSFQKLKDVLPAKGYQLESISTSACKMATLERLNLFSLYTDYVLASPENVHLSHFDLDHLKDRFTMDPITNLKGFLDDSFRRISRFTKSNLVLHIYDTRVEFSKNICESKDQLYSKLIDSQIKLSKFELKSENSSHFIISNCNKENL